MEQFIQILLPVYFITYFLFAFLIRSIQVYQRTGNNPMVLPRDDTAYGIIGFYFKLTMVGLFFYVFLYTFLPASRLYVLPILLPMTVFFKWLGFVLMILALGVTIIAQSNMKDSWRIGIDNHVKTDLIMEGLFRFCRNPIFSGMLLVLAGLFMVTPNAATLLFWVVGYILIQIQIRLEEDFLLQQHGEKYEKYCNLVRRRLILSTKSRLRFQY